MEPNFFRNDIPEELVKDVISLAENQQYSVCKKASFSKFVKNEESPFCEGCFNLFLSPLERLLHMYNVNSLKK